MGQDGVSLAVILRLYVRVWWWRGVGMVGTVVKVLRGLWGKPHRDGWKRSPGDSGAPTHPLSQLADPLD